MTVNTPGVKPVKLEQEARYERKFLVDQLDEGQIRTLVRVHRGLFHEPYPPRYVNNIYLDTPDMDCYYDNVDGCCNRCKVRVRWYGELLGPVERPVLELKIKQGVVGWKRSYPLPPLVIDRSFKQRDFLELLLSSDAPEELKERLRGMTPVLMNRYHRRYYVSRDQRYRLTLDTELEFRRVEGLTSRFVHRQEDYTTVIVELKYGVADERGATNISSSFPFRRTKSSKYVQGIERVFF